MSHFPVLVIGENPEQQLEPFWELDLAYPDIKEDERSEFVDCTADVLEGWESTRDQIEIDGKYFSPYDTMFRGLDSEPYSYPKNSKKVNVPLKQIYSSLEEFVTKDQGYHVENIDGEERYGYWCNPNGKWDWHSLGGRWRGAFMLKAKELPNDAAVGNPGVFDNKPLFDCDQALKGQIDFAGMAIQARIEAEKHYQEIADLFGGEIPAIKRWSEFYEDESLTLEEKREAYNNQDGIKKSHALKSKYWIELDDFQCTKEEYATRASENSCVMFAVVKDGEWYEKGRMGWWGAVSEEKSDEEWNVEYSKLIDSLPDDTLLSVYDCHI